MPGLWPDKFTSVTTINPKDLIERESKALEETTNGLVYASLTPSALGMLDKHVFIYDMIIKSKYLENYSFEVFSIKYDIPFYPLTLILEENIYKELEAGDKVDEFFHEREMTAETETALLDILKRIFCSERLGLVIGSLIHITKK